MSMQEMKEAITLLQKQVKELENRLATQDEKKSKKKEKEAPLPAES